MNTFQLAKDRTVEEPIVVDEDNQDPENSPFLKEKFMWYKGYYNMHIEDGYEPERAPLTDALHETIYSPTDYNLLIWISDSEFKCDTQILSAYSNFFDALDVPVLYFFPENVSVESFVAIINWILVPEATVRREGVLDLFAAAHYLQFAELEKQCWSFFNMNGNCLSYSFDMYMEARVRSNQLIMDMMVTRISKFFLLMVACKQFLELRLEEIMNFFRSSVIAVNDEVEVFLAGVRWLDFDWENRKEHCLEVMNCVRFPLLSMATLLDISSVTKDMQFDHERVKEILLKPEMRIIINTNLANATDAFYNEDSDSEDDSHFEVKSRFFIKDPMKESFEGNSISNTFSNFLMYLDTLRSMSGEYLGSL